MMTHDLPEEALEEEIGIPELFTGRHEDLAYFLNWASEAKRKLSQSHVILARKRRGKTALVQRLFNILYTQNDPKIIPFYICIDEEPTTQLDFSVRLFTSLFSQYLGFKRRDPGLIRTPLLVDQLAKEIAGDTFLSRIVDEMQSYVVKEQSELAWELARELGHSISSVKDERIIQIIDEFQFLEDRAFVKDDLKVPAKLGSFYQRTGSSKVSPQIITGSYIGKLSKIVRDSYDHYYLEPLTTDEAFAAVYNYSTVLRQEVSDETAAYMVQACHRDTYYIARTFRSQYPRKDLTSKENIREILQFETGEKGNIYAMWMEYLDHAFTRINDKNAKKIVLYLAHHGENERTRKEILDDLNLDIDDYDLEKKLHKLVKADIIAGGRSNYDYKGLGDPIFAMVIRKKYQREIDQIPIQSIEGDLDQQLKHLKGAVAYYKGVNAEYRILNRVLFLGQKRTPAERVFHGVPEGFQLGPFAEIGKRKWHVDQEHSLEADLYAEAEDRGDSDVIMEIKHVENLSGLTMIEAFIAKCDQLRERLPRPATFAFYSETGFTDVQAARLEAAGIMYSDGNKLFS